MTAIKAEVCTKSNMLSLYSVKYITSSDVTKLKDKLMWIGFFKVAYKKIVTWQALSQYFNYMPTTWYH